MNPVWIIAKKRDGDALTDAEIGHFIAGYADGAIPDYQMSALAMAIYLRGMTTDETASLTDHMLASGARFEWPAQLGTEGRQTLDRRHRRQGLTAARADACLL